MALRKTLRRYRGWIAVAVVVVIAGVTWTMMRSASASEEPTTTYSTQAAEKGTLSVTVSGTGNLAVASTTDVWPSSAGTVASVEVTEGAVVSKGDVLFTLGPDDAEAATAKALATYRQAQSQVAQGQAQVVKAQASLDSIESRAESPSSTVSASDIDVAEADLASAKASLASAKTSQASALEEYEDAAAAEDDLEVVAPCDGRVYALNVSAGDSVSASGANDSAASSSASGASATGATSSSASTGSGASSAPVVLSEEGPMVATLSVNEVDLPQIALGQRADLEFDALPGLALTGKVTAISDEGTVDSGVVSFDVEITLDVANEQLKPGMSVSATVVTAVARDVLLVPNAAVKSDDEGNYVQVLASADSQPQQVRVETGMAGDSQTEIASGLSEGDLVVTATTDSSDESESTQRSGGGFPMMGGGPGR